MSADRARELYRGLPGVDTILSSPRTEGLPVGLVAEEARRLLDELRRGIAAGEVRDLPDVAAVVGDRARQILAGTLRPVVNATGVVIHTNLGRSPWAPEAVARAAAVASGYSSLEMLLDTGRRGGRGGGVFALLRHLTGAEAAVVVNNNAAAVLLALTALARDGEVVVSRGELVEIGGSFRIPDVIASGGAVMREVGTTNRTRAADYAAAITDDTAVLLKVHRSNFRIVGFSEEASRAELSALARARGLLLVEDLGSGSLDGDHGEPAVRDVVSSGVDLVTFSGDKLLGGPQVGICVGRADAVRRLRSHPMYRALRVDKVTLAALEATLGLWAQGILPPAAELLATPADALRPRAEALVEHLLTAGVPAALAEDVGYSGGGALPGRALPSWTAVVEDPRPDVLARALRLGEPSVVPRVARDAVRFDVRTLTDAELPVVAVAVARARADLGRLPHS